MHCFPIGVPGHPMEPSAVPRGAASKNFFNASLKNTFFKWHQIILQIAMSLPVGVANCISLLQGAISLRRLGNTDLMDSVHSSRACLPACPIVI